MTIWGEAHGWIYEMFPLDTPSDSIGILGPFKELWDAKCIEDAIPAWRDFELEDFADWYGWVIVEDVLPEPEYNSKIRLWGSNITKLYGFDLTGKKSRDYEGVLYSVEDFQMCKEIVNNKSFRVCSGPLDWNQDHYWNPTTHYTMIQMPLADDHENVDKLIVLIQPIPASSLEPC